MKNIFKSYLEFGLTQVGEFNTETTIDIVCPGEILIHYIVLGNTIRIGAWKLLSNWL